MTETATITTIGYNVTITQGGSQTVVATSDPDQTVTIVSDVSSISSLAGTLQNSQVAESNVTQHATAVAAAIDLGDLSNVNIPILTDGQVLTYDEGTDTWVAGSASGGGGGSGTVTSVALSVPTGFTVSGSPVTSSGTLAISTTLDGVLIGNGAGTISGDATLNDLSDVNIATGAGNDGDLVYFNNSGGAGDKFKGVARSSIDLSEFNDDLDYAASSHTHTLANITDAGTAAASDTGDFATAAQGSTADSALQDVVDDLSPQLGGNLDVNGQSIVSASAGNILITPDTTGKIVLDGLSWPTADGTTNQVLKTDGSGNLSFATVSGGGGGSGSPETSGYIESPTSADNTWRFWYDFFDIVPDRGGVGPTWLNSGGSGVSVEEGPIAGARGAVSHSFNADSDRYTYWGGPALAGYQQADGDELFWEVRIYITDSLATSGNINFGVVDRINTLNVNDTPPSDGFSTFDYACIVLNLSETYIRTAVKDNGGSGNSTVTDLTSYPRLSYVDDWVRFGIHAQYNATNSNWDITYYINGTSVGTTTITFNDWLVPFVGASVGTSAGTFTYAIDWISYQYKIGGLISGRTDHLSLEDL